MRGAEGGFRRQGRGGERGGEVGKEGREVNTEKRGGGLEGVGGVHGGATSSTGFTRGQGVWPPFEEPFCSSHGVGRGEGAKGGRERGRGHPGGGGEGVQGGLHGFNGLKNDEPFFDPSLTGTHFSHHPAAHPSTRRNVFLDTRMNAFLDRPITSFLDTHKRVS